MFRRDKGIVRERNRHGNVVYFYRDGHGPRIRIRGVPGTPEFNAAVAAAKGGHNSGNNSQLLSPTALRHNDPHSLAWLIDQYQSSAAWAKTAKATQKGRRNHLKLIIAKSGSVPFRSLTQRDIEASHAERAKTGATAQADAVLKTMRCLFDWAKKRGLMSTNIARDVELISRKSDGFHTWTEDEIARFVAFYPDPASRERRALAVLLWTGQRRGDVVKFGPHSLLLNGRLKLRTSKTGTPVSIPVLPQLKAALDVGSQGQTWIVGDKGGPMSADAFTTWFRQVCNAAGVPGSAHGLRKAAARRFAEAGASVDELKAWFGWVENRTPGIYTKDADAARLADNAARRMAA